MKELRELGIKLSDRENRLISALMVISATPESTGEDNFEVRRLHDCNVRTATAALQLEVKKAKEEAEKLEKRLYADW